MLPTFDRLSLDTGFGEDSISMLPPGTKEGTHMKTVLEKTESPSPHAKEKGGKLIPLSALTLADVLRWIKDYKFLISALLAGVLGAIGGFLATRTNMSSQIDELRTRIVKSEALRNDINLRMFYVQRSNLRILEDEIPRIQEFVNRWNPPELKWEKNPNLPQSPAGLGIAGIIFNYNGEVYPSDEARMKAEMGDKVFCMGNLLTDTYEQVMLSPNLLSALEESLPESVPMCEECAFLPYCGADPDYHYATQKDVVGHKALSGFCAKNMGVVRYIIQKMEDDSVARSIFERWVRW